MSRISRLAVLVTALASLLAVLSSTAGAATFTNTGSTAFTADGGPGIFGITTSGGAQNNLGCGFSNWTGTSASGAFTAINGTATFTGCLFESRIDCSYSLTPTTFTSPNVTHGVLDLHCVYKLQTSPFTERCTISGQTSVSYTNPSSPTKGTLTLSASNTLVASNSSGSSCMLFGVPAGTTRPVDLTEQTINITNGTPTTLGPIIISP